MTANSLPNGFALQEYCVEKLLGVGGFGLTYLATDTNLNLKVAVKEYLPSDFAVRSEDQSVQPKSEELAESFRWGRQRFIDESRTLASFRHPNIVRVMRFFEANQTAYMVMEFVSGSSMPEWIKTRRPLSQAALLNMALPLLDGLKVIHKSGYLHRDIKPGNIYMRDDDSPVLLDFGSARQVGGNSELTAIVTPGYAPFEQYHAGGNQGPWSDLYAFGGMLYWMLTGSKPVEAIARVRSDSQIPTTKVGDANLYSLDFLAAIDWALQPHEESRPQSVDALMAALSGTRSGDATTVSDKTQLIVTASHQNPSAADTTQTTQTPTGLANGLTGVVFNMETLKKIGAALAKHIGPIAPVVLKNAAKKIHSVTALVAMVAEEIADEKARAAFIKTFSSSEDSKPVSSPHGAPSQPLSADKTALSRISPEVLERAEKSLAQHIGAVAKIVVKRAAAKASDENQLYLLIADEIENKDERRSFIRKSISIPKN